MLDGRVLVAGGVDFDGFGLATAELYDPATGTWQSTGTMVQNRIGHTATLLLSGKVLVTAGHAGGNHEGGGDVRSCEIYDPATGRWHGIHWLSIRRTSHTATLLPSGKVLVAGGRGGDGGNQPTSVVQVYDPETGDWSALPDMPIPQLHTATLLPSGRVLTAGGGGIEISNPGGEEPPPFQPELCHIFDPEASTSAWSRTGDLIVGRRASGVAHTATLLKNGTVLVAGGRSIAGDAEPGETLTIAESETYDPAVGAWAATGSLTHGRAWHTATLLSDSTVLAVGGHQDLVGVHDSGERYVPRTRTWVPAGRMAHRRYQHTATLLTDGSVLVVGGYTEFARRPSNGKATATAELFTLNCRSQPR